MYSIGLNPRLYKYMEPTLMPNGTEMVSAYCRFPDVRTSACMRLGREGKSSNAAALQRGCPTLGHGWVLDVAVENVPRARLVRRARRLRARWKRAPQATSAAAAPPPTQPLQGTNASAVRGLDVDVIVLMLDSISMRRFAHGMPITHALLEQWAGADGSSPWRSFRFDKFAVVGSNSPRNQLPLMSGYTSLEWARDHGGLALDCIVPGFPEVRAPRSHVCQRWVFDDYKAAGYVTLFGTNMCDWGVMEEVYPFDTHHPPTDHHLMEPWCHVDYDVDKLYFRPMSRCLGGRPAHAPLMHYERQFARNYAHVRTLQWTIYLEGHEPSFRSMGQLDADLAAHLLRLRADHAERTAVLLLSDHGIHYGRYYDGAKAGPQEHTLPLFYALLPRSLLAQRPALKAALCMNQRRLVSPFDVHATLRHILVYPDTPKLPDWSIATYPLRPRSLLEPIPAERTCVEAGVPPDVCPCQQQ
uniref:Sulfatase N-terminal domain-containing protein n=1 Tax=Calcidiscus leptoporus TaxID=127549 RepID=A0A7S0IZ33_9EUKA